MVKPTEVNHFTGKALPESSQSPTRSRPSIMNERGDSSRSPTKFVGPNEIE